MEEKELTEQWLSYVGFKYSLDYDSWILKIDAFVSIIISPIDYSYGLFTSMTDLRECNEVCPSNNLKTIGDLNKLYFILTGIKSLNNKKD